MKSVFALFATLGLSLMTFIGGLVVATVLMSAAEPSHRLGGSDVASLWTDEPVHIDPARNTFERLPSRQAGSEAVPARSDAATASLKLEHAGEQAEDDAVPSVALAGAENPVMDTAVAPVINEAHLEWCSSRYRSYRPRDNSYTAYSGGRRECISPFPSHSEETVAAVNTSVSPAPDGQDSFSDSTFDEAAESAQLEPQVEQASLEGATGFVTAEHAQSCSARYRSYTPNDNTYQPYGGGPRVQCQ
jgi:hypothetical protein